MIRATSTAIGVLLASPLACSSSSTDHPPIVTSSGPGCRPPACSLSPPRAAFAVETVPAVEGGTCASPAPPLSLPGGGDALRAIVSCGGNQVRCGAVDYRVGDGDRDIVTCTVTGGASASDASTAAGPVHVTAHAASAGEAVDIVGDVDAAGGSVTITATSEAGTRVLDGARCVAVTRYANAGTLYADFTCAAGAAADGGGAACLVRGTFVFESCGSE